jgi:phosphoglycolate phosphatase
MNFDLIIFDLDGTLIDSQADVRSAVNRLFGDFEIAPIDAETIHKHVGYGVKPLIEKTLKENNVRSFEGAINLFTEYYLENCLDETVLFPEVADVLINLSQYKKVVLTNKSNIFVGKILAGLEIETQFIGHYGRESFVKQKPDPLPILSILQEHNVSLDRALIVGDTETDIIAGENAGIKTCLVTYGYGKQEKLKTLNPNFTISSFAELLPTVGFPHGELK